MGNWWERLDKLSTAFTDLSDINLITEEKDVRTFSTLAAELAPGRLYEPVALRMYFGYESPSSYMYAGLRSMQVAAEGVAQGDPRQIRRLVTFEIGMVYGGSEIIFASENKVFDLGVEEFKLDLSIADTTAKTATFTWEAGTETGTVTHDLGFTRTGKAGFMVSKNGNACHVKFQDVSISGIELEEDPDNVREVYQYTTFNGKACVWDANGNLTQYGNATDHFYYDAFNRMTEANGVKYLYDAQNRRVAKIDGADTYVYIYHGWSVIAEYKNGALQREFVEGISTDEHICMIDAGTGTKYFYILDTRNSVDKIVDADGNVVEDYEYTAYGDTKINGTATMTSSIGNPYSFQGRRMDPESGLMYFRNRQYSPEMKRFISMDPMGYVDSMNLYETFGCDPVNKVDRSGNFIIRAGQKKITPWDIVAPAGVGQDLIDKYNEAELSWLITNYLLNIKLASRELGQISGEEVMDLVTAYASKENDPNTRFIPSIWFKDSEELRRLKLIIGIRGATKVTLGSAAIALEYYISGGLLTAFKSTLVKGFGAYMAWDACDKVQAVLTGETNAHRLGKTLGYTEQEMGTIRTVNELAKIPVVLAACYPGIANKKIFIKTSPSLSTGSISVSGQRSIAQSAARSTAKIPDDALAHFAPNRFSVIKTNVGKSYWFRYGDIKHLTPKQIETLIGPGAKSGASGMVKIMHVLRKAPSSVTTQTQAATGFVEYILTQPAKTNLIVPVK